MPQTKRASFPLPITLPTHQSMAPSHPVRFNYAAEDASKLPVLLPQPFQCLIPDSMSSVPFILEIKTLSRPEQGFSSLIKIWTERICVDF